MNTKATFTELLRSPKTVLSLIDDGDIIITRRDGEDLIVSKASTRSKDREGLRLASTLIAVSLGDGDFITRLHDPFPWMTFLSAEEQQKCADEVVEVARGCAYVGHFGRLSITISAWEASATASAEGFQADGSDLHYLDEPIIVQRP